MNQSFIIDSCDYYFSCPLFFLTISTEKAVHISRCEWKEPCYSTVPIFSKLPHCLSKKQSDPSLKITFDDLSTANLIVPSILWKDLKTTRVTKEFALQSELIASSNQCQYFKSYLCWLLTWST